MTQKFEYTVLDMIQSAARVQKTAPLNLGGVGGAGGGVGVPPGGFIGKLPQWAVAYDTLEAATSGTLSSGVSGASGWSLVDNLNHIRYRLGVIESGGAAGTIIVQDWDGTPTIDPTSRIIFSGATVVDLGGGTALVVVGSGGAAGSSKFALISSDYTYTTVADNATGTIILDTELYNDDGLVSLSSNNVTVLEDGWYDVSVTLALRINGGSALAQDGLFKIYIANDGFFDNTYDYHPTLSGHQISSEDFYARGTVYLTAAGGNTFYVQIENHTGHSLQAYAHEVLVRPCKAFGGTGGGGTPLTVRELDGSPTVTNVSTITLSGITASDLGGGEVLLSVAASSGSGGSPLTVMEQDGSPVVSNVSTILFSGASVTDLGGGMALVSISGYTQENIEDIVGGMVTGSTQTGISVTYDDAAGKINFDAQTAGDARYEKLMTGTTVASITTTDHTLSSPSNSGGRNVVLVDLSGLTADRTIFIAGGSVGTTLEIVVTAGHATYKCFVAPKAAGAGSTTINGTTTAWDGYLQSARDGIKLVHSGVTYGWEVTGFNMASSRLASPLIVEEADGSPSVSGVGKIIFSGATVTDLGGGNALVSISGISNYDSRYLKLDASNDPITGMLSVYPTTQDNDSLSVTAKNFVGVRVTQLGVGDALSVNNPAFAIIRTQSEGSDIEFNQPAIQVVDSPNIGLITGDFLSFQRDATVKFNVTQSGHAYDNGNLLITEAPIDGNYYVRKNSGWTTISGLGEGSGGDIYMWVDGALAVASGVTVPILFTKYTEVSKIYAYIETTGTSGTTIVDANLNGVTLFSNQSQRPQIAYNASPKWTSSIPETMLFSEGDVLTFDIDQIASGSSSLLLALRVKSTSETPSAGIGKRMLTFAYEGDLPTFSGHMRLYNVFGEDLTITQVFIAADTAPTGADIIVDVNKNGTTLFTTQSNRPRILAGNNTGVSTTIENNSFTAGSYLTMDIDQRGSTVHGSDLTVHVVFE